MFISNFQSDFSRIHNNYYEKTINFFSGARTFKRRRYGMAMAKKL